MKTQTILKTLGLVLLSLAVTMPMTSCSIFHKKERATVQGQNTTENQIPIRPVPEHFKALQREASSGLSSAQRKSYEKFCAQKTYPNILATWTNEELVNQHGTCRVHINLTSQRGLLLVNGQVAMDFPVCTGRPSHRTPTGSFCILQKDPRHYSNLYHHAPMHCFMRLTWDGVGMHIGNMVGYPASHGCIRMPADACRKVFSRMPMGGSVRISS